jgi:hypothetical protein
MRACDVQILMRADETKGEEKMKIGVLGSGMVCATIATKLIALGNEVMLGSCKAGSEKAVARATEQMMPIWLRFYGVLGVLHFNFRVVAEGGRS